ncbi:nucleotide-diphospho-sugar transferase [Mycena rebaudengoi]|nr:nucleotide-diphospho-sugar transferase [Mycena rebaudengoi]
MERGISIAPVDEKELKMRPWYSRWGRRKITNFAMRHEIVVVAADALAVILPFPPTIEEKYIYAQIRRVPLYIFGTLSFLSVPVGMWFFSISSDMFVWFIALGIIVQLYLIVSYGVGYTGRDYDLGNHRKVVAEFATSPGDDPSVLQGTARNPRKHLEVCRPAVVHELQSTCPRRRRTGQRQSPRGEVRIQLHSSREPWFFTIFDADFCPCHDFLQEILPLMRKEPDIAIVQTPQFFRPCDEQTWVEQGGRATQELFSRVVQVNRDHWGAAICVGSNAVYRREALKEVGGTAEIGHLEDVHTGFYAVYRGWRLKYIPIALACRISPDTAKAYFSQQMRWCSGSTTLLSNPEFWKSELTIVQKLCFLTGRCSCSRSNRATSCTITSYSWSPPSSTPSPSSACDPVRDTLNVNFVYVIQQYAYLIALKDKLFNTTAAWVPSGDTKEHEGAKVKGGNNKYRNSRIQCAV